MLRTQVYLKGFYEGVMLMGPCAGEKVCDAKAKIRKELMDRGDAMPFFEPESLVVSRYCTTDARLFWDHGWRT